MTTLLCVLILDVLVVLGIARLTALNSREEGRLGLTRETQIQRSVARVLHQKDSELVHWES